MPKYDIHCVDCDKDYEIEKSYTDITPMTCPKGHRRIVRKIKVAPPVKYRGEGFTKKVEEI